MTQQQTRPADRDLVILSPLAVTYARSSRAERPVAKAVHLHPWMARLAQLLFATAVMLLGVAIAAIAFLGWDDVLTAIGAGIFAAALAIFAAIADRYAGRDDEDCLVGEYVYEEV